MTRNTATAMAMTSVFKSRCRIIFSTSRTSHAPARVNQMVERRIVSENTTNGLS